MEKGKLQDRVEFHDETKEFFHYHKSVIKPDVVLDSACCIHCKWPVCFIMVLWS